MNIFGNFFKVSTFGESHGKAVGVVVDGCPAGLELSEKDIQADLDRRRPGQSKISTPRNEADQVEIMSGVFEGKTTGSPIMMIVFNKDQRSKDYNELKKLVRPGHADFTYNQKYGNRDPRGGGRSSARIMIARVAAGAIAKKFLKEKAGMEFVGWTEQIGNIKLSDQMQKGKSTIKKAKTNQILSLPLDTVFESERLKFEPISFDYLEEIFHCFTDNIAKYINLNVVLPTKIFETAEFIHTYKKKWEEGSTFDFVATKKDTKEFVGLCGVHDFDLANKKTYLGLWVKENLQKKGFGTEMMQRLMVFCQKKFDLQKFGYKAEENNASSRKLAEKLGGKLVKTYPEKDEKTGKSFVWVEYELGI